VHEENVLNKMRDLPNRLNLIEPEVGGNHNQGSASKRARSVPVRTTPQKPSAILCGFHEQPRMKDIEAFVKDELNKLPRWSTVEGFAPVVRSSVAIIKLSAQAEIKTFIADAKFKDHIVRTRQDKPPEKRRSDSRMFMINEDLKQKHVCHEFDMDLKKACAWMGDEKLVEWCVEGEAFAWNEGQAFGIGMDRASAERHASQ
jgi:hypothetical protein